MNQYNQMSMWIFYFAFSLIYKNIYVLSLRNTAASNQSGYCQIRSEEEPVCCTNYYLNNGTCLECPVGTLRFEFRTEKCLPCRKGFYGRFCAFECDDNCKTGCNPVDGHCCIDNEDMCLTEVETKKMPDLVKEEPITKHLLSYGLPGVLFVALMVLIVFIIKWKMTRTIQTGDNQHKNDTSIPLECEYGYAIIDESKLIEQPQNLKSKKTGDAVHICDETMLSRRESPSRDIGSSKEKKNERKTDDYLQPVFENDRLSVGNESDRSDSSIKTDVPVNSDTYLHPYNTLRPDWRSRTHVYNDEEPEVKGDGYLNPYQPLQENWLQNTHIYNTVKKTNLSPEKQNDEDVIIEDCSSKQCEKLSLAKGQN